MALAISEDVVDGIGTARAQTPTLDLDWLGIARMAHDVDNTSSELGRDRSVWSKAVFRRGSNHPFSRIISSVPDWVAAVVNDETLTTMSFATVPTALQVMVDALARISYASELPEGWFERGSVGLSGHARTAAIDFVFRLADEGLLAKDVSLDLIPTPIGGIQFEWAGDNGEIEVEIDAQGHFHTLVESPDGTLDESPRSMPLSASAVLPKIKRILG